MYAHEIQLLLPTAILEALSDAGLVVPTFTAPRPLSDQETAAIQAFLDAYGHKATAADRIANVLFPEGRAVERGADEIGEIANILHSAGLGPIS
jgi:hypothetical protein